MQNKYALAALTSLSIFVLASSAQASYRDHRTSYQSQLKFDLPTLPPLAFTRFCMRYPAECGTGSGSAIPAASEIEAPLGMTPDFSGRAELVEVNRLVNRSIAPRRYVGSAAFDSWTIAPRAGDCNDYAITKRSLLRHKGWPAERLLLAEVQIPSGEHHLVLIVRLNGEDVVLDNLTGTLRNWSQTPYRWVRVQSPDNGHIWSTLLPTEDDLLS